MTPEIRRAVARLVDAGFAEVADLVKELNRSRMAWRIRAFSRNRELMDMGHRMDALRRSSSFFEAYRNMLRLQVDKLNAQLASAQARNAELMRANEVTRREEADTFRTLRSLTEAIMTKADADYMRRIMDESVYVMTLHGCTPPVPWPPKDTEAETLARQAQDAEKMFGVMPRYSPGKAWDLVIDGSGSADESAGLYATGTAGSGGAGTEMFHKADHFVKPTKTEIYVCHGGGAGGVSTEPSKGTNGNPPYDSLEADGHPTC